MYSVYPVHVFTHGVRSSGRPLPYGDAITGRREYQRSTVAVGDGVGVSVFVAVAVGEGVSVGVFVAVAVGEGVSVSVFVALAVGEGVAERVAVREGVSVCVGVAVAVALGVAAARPQTKPAQRRLPPALISKATGRPMELSSVEPPLVCHPPPPLSTYQAVALF